MSKRKTQRPAMLSLDQVERLAELSRLSLSAREAEHLRGEFAPILEYFATLDKVDVSGVPRFEEAATEPGTREDVPRPSIPRELLEGVPHKKGRYVRAPRVF